MIYQNTKSAIFIKRINRFLGIVNFSGEKVEVHIPNTSRLEELLINGSQCFIQPAKNKDRKTKYTLISIYKENKLFNLDSQIPHKLLYELLNYKKLEELKYLRNIRKEVTFGHSRLDLAYYNPLTKKEGFIEVKGVTLEKNGIATFPGAPTVRGTKHLLDLINAVNKGYEAMVFFLLQFQGANILTPHVEMDPVFSKTLKKASQSGVKLLAYDSLVTKNSLEINKKIPVIIHE